MTTGHNLALPNEFGRTEIGAVLVDGDVVQDAAGNPLSNSTPVWIKMVSEKQGTMYCRTGEPSLYLQEVLFKFISKDGDVFGEYTLTVIRSQGDPTALSRTYWLKMNSHVNAGQQSNIIFKRNY
jgi:hypothetical protein